MKHLDPHLQKQLSKLENDKYELSKKIKQDHENLQLINRQIAVIEKQMNDQNQTKLF